MKKFYLHNGQEQQGPFSIDELKDKKITKETSVWSEGMENWKKASEIEELKELFIAVPPPFVPTPPPFPQEEKIFSAVENGNQKKEKKKSNKIIPIVIISVILVGGIGGYFWYLKYQDDAHWEHLRQQQDAATHSSWSSNSSASDNTNSTPSSSNEYQSSTQNNYSPPPKEKTPEELRQELKEKEIYNPRSYLSVNYTLTYKAFSGKDEIDGHIYNSATMATFKDVYLTVTYSTGTNTELKREDFVVYQYVSPNSSTSFQIKTNSPTGTKKIGVQVKSATGQ